MTYQDPSQPWQAPPPPPVPPKRKPHYGRRVTLIIAGAIAVIVVIAVAASAGSNKDKKTGAQHIATSTSASASTSSSAPAPAVEESTSEAPPAAVPNPDGTFSGSCDYELATDIDNYDTHAGDLNGEVDVENTGNVGIVVKVTITWPQLGHTPIAMSKNVRVAYGQAKTVPFTKPVGSAVIERLQSWQEGHDYKDGCTYNGKMTDTFGAVH